MQIRECRADTAPPQFRPDRRTDMSFSNKQIPVSRNEHKDSINHIPHRYAVCSSNNGRRRTYHGEPRARPAECLRPERRRQRVPEQILTTHPLHPFNPGRTDAPVRTPLEKANSCCRHRSPLSAISTRSSSCLNSACLSRGRSPRT